MKTVILSIVLIIWFIFTIILVFSIVGLLILSPVPNNTEYHMDMTDERRSTWMLIGLDIKRKLLE